MDFDPSGDRFAFWDDETNYERVYHVTAEDFVAVHVKPQ